MAQSSMGQPSPTAAASMASHGVIPTVGEVPVVARAVNSNQFQQPNMMPLQQPQAPRNPFEDPPEVVAQQQRLLIDATRKVQEHAYYMKQAMERNDLPAVLDRAASMVGELGEHAHSHHHHRLNPPARGATGTTTALSPKNYYELHLRALEEMPTLEDYLLNIAQGNASSAPTNNSSTMPPPQPMMQVNPKNGLHQPVSYTMKELYDCVQYSPNVLSRLYLQICAASALIRSGEVGARWVMKDLIEAVKCVQNPVRGLFLRHYLLQAFRDKLPDEAIPLDQVGPPMTPFAQQYAESLTQEEGEDAKPEATTTVTAANATSVEKGNVKDSYQFILANFIEMNKLWVRIQHLPGDGRSKDIRRRRERERNELRILVGTNMVRLSALESITSSIYGQVILPTVLDHIVISADPLAQAYLIDCITQVFPDEYHIETMPILLGVCPKLRDKVNIRTILQALMSRLTNYLSDEELLDEKDTNQVKKALARDSFKMFDECVKNVYNARGPKLQAKEVIRLQTALLSFTKKCFPENREQVVMCLNHCVLALQQASANLALMQDFQNGPSSQQPPPRVPLDPVATKELENLLSIPMDEMGLGVLTLDHYSDLIGFLPWANRRQVALTLLQAISNKGSPPESIEQLEQLFAAIAPVLRNEFDVVPSAQPTERTANLMAGLGVAPTMQHPGFQPQQSFPNGGAECREDAAMISKLIHLLNHSDTDVLYDMLIVTRNHLSQRTASAHLALVFASFKLATRILDEEGGRIETTAETKEVGKEEDAIETKEQGGEGDTAETKKEEMEKERGVTPEELSGGEEKPSVPTEKKPPAEVNAVTSRAINCRKVLIFTQETIALLSKRKPETCIKLYLEAALVADKFGKREEGEEATFGPIAQLFLSQSLSLYEANSDDSRLQSRCVVAIIGTLLACRSLGKEEYECLIMKAAQYAAKVQKKPEQCEMVALCSHLFYVVREDVSMPVFKTFSFASFD
jgi:vacuolar protein sorting-associated protein 35